MTIDLNLRENRDGLEFPREYLESMNANTAFHEDYSAKGRAISELKEAILTLANIVNEFSPLSGTSSPVNTVVSNRSQVYYNIGTTKEIWFNPTIGVNTGWVKVT